MTRTRPRFPSFLVRRRGVRHFDQEVIEEKPENVEAERESFQHPPDDEDTPEIPELPSKEDEDATLEKDPDAKGEGKALLGDFEQEKNAEDADRLSPPSRQLDGDLDEEPEDPDAKREGKALLGDFEQEKNAGEEHPDADRLSSPSRQLDDAIPETENLDADRLSLPSSNTPVEPDSQLGDTIPAKEDDTIPGSSKEGEPGPDMPGDPQDGVHPWQDSDLEGNKMGGAVGQAQQVGSGQMKPAAGDDDVSGSW